MRKGDFLVEKRSCQKAAFFAPVMRVENLAAEDVITTSGANDIILPGDDFENDTTPQ